MIARSLERVEDVIDNSSIIVLPQPKPGLIYIKPGAQDTRLRNQIKGGGKGRTGVLRNFLKQSGVDRSTATRALFLPVLGIRFSHSQKHPGEVQVGLAVEDIANPDYKSSYQILGELTAASYFAEIEGENLISSLQTANNGEVPSYDINIGRLLGKANPLTDTIFEDKRLPQEVALNYIQVIR